VREKCDGLIESALSGIWQFAWNGARFQTIADLEKPLTIGSIAVLCSPQTMALNQFNFRLFEEMN
jgi:hypothetical protein